MNRTKALVIPETDKSESKEGKIDPISSTQNNEENKVVSPSRAGFTTN